MEKVKQKNNINVSKYVLLVFTIAVGIVFAVLQPTFISFGNLTNVVSSTVVLCIASIGLSLVMITGEIDFACGSELAAAACMSVVLYKKGIPYVLVLVIVLLFCASVGAVNGFLHTRIGIPGFIATMGTSFVLDGFSKWFTGGKRVTISTGGNTFSRLGQYRIGGVIPISIVVLLLVVVAMLIYTEGMTNGRKLYAVGSNDSACKYIGIDARKEKMKAFIISAVLCGLAGIINASQLNMANPYMGETTLVNLLTMLMLGATFYRIGEFNVPGTIVGALLVNIINNGMVLVGAETWQQFVLQGAIMLGAVTLITILRARVSKKG
ncbi:MAG: ABC transporter permease [Ruminococcus sp.]|nr:ABC transporter permease [Ruminococcus sp.]